MVICTEVLGVQRENEPQGGMSRTWLSQGRKIIQFRWRMRRWSGPCEAHLGFSPPTEKDRALSAGGGWIKQKMLSGSHHLQSGFGVI
jgi:hypothetical protein